MKIGTILALGCGLVLLTSCTTSKPIPCHTRISLEGRVVEQKFPGPPDYDDIKTSWETYWILKLKAPIDVEKDPDYPVPDENKAPKNVGEIQLVMDYGKYRQFLGRDVVVQGSLWQGYTVHHKTAVLMEVEWIGVK